MIADHIALPKPLDFILYHVFLYTFWVEGIYFQRKIHKFIPKALDLRIFDILTSWAFRIYGSFLRKMPSVYLDFRKAWSAKWSPIMIVIWSLRILTKWSWVIVDHIMVKVSWVIVDHEKCDRTLLWLKESATTWRHYSSSVVNLSIRKQILLLTGTKSIKTKLTMPYIKRWIEKDIQANYFFEIVHIFILISIDFSPANSWNFFILAKYTVLMLCK